MKLCIVRHLATPWNKARRIQGSRDIALCPQERPTTEQVARVRALAPFDRVLCSPLARTQQTARLFGFEAFEIAEEVAEMDFGELEGTSVEALYGGAYGDWRERPLETPLRPNLEAMLGRIERFLDAQRAAGGERVLVFGHSLWSRATYARHVLGDANLTNTLRLANGEMFEIEL